MHVSPGGSDKYLEKFNKVNKYCPYHHDTTSVGMACYLICDSWIVMMVKLCYPILP